MKRFVEFSVHEYMDECPRTEIRTFKGDTLEQIEASAKEFAEEMTRNYSGGPTKFVKVMTKEDACNWYESEKAKIGNPDAADKLWMTNVVEFIRKCYDTED